MLADPPEWLDRPSLRSRRTHGERYGLLGFGLELVSDEGVESPVPLLLLGGEFSFPLGGFVLPGLVFMLGFVFG